MCCPTATFLQWFTINDLLKIVMRRPTEHFTEYWGVFNTQPLKLFSEIIYLHVSSHCKFLAMNFIINDLCEIAEVAH